jgi:hypothetical protein
MRKLKVVQLLLVMALSSMSSALYADAHTVVSIKKITTITGSDADRFKNVFSDVALLGPELSIQCGKKSCEITTSRAGFSGGLAKQLLNGRKEAVFLSENNKFKLQCGESGVPFCNVTQKDGILE